MADVQFNEPVATLKALPRPRGITAFLIHIGAAKDEPSANVLQLGIAILAVILTVVLWVSGVVAGNDSGITPQERVRIEALP